MNTGLRDLARQHGELVFRTLAQFARSVQSDVAQMAYRHLYARGLPILDVEITVTLVCEPRQASTAQPPSSQMRMPWASHQGQEAADIIRSHRVSPQAAGSGDRVSPS
jgi:hypothetical protein